MVANEFGGRRKNELLIKLEKLVKLAKGENGIIEKTDTEINNLSTTEEKEIAYTDRYISYKGTTFYEKVYEVKASRLQPYDMVMEILRLANLYGCWYEINIFDTSELYHYFFMEVEKIGSKIEINDNEFKII